MILVDNITEWSNIKQVVLQMFNEEIQTQRKQQIYNSVLEVVTKNEDKFKKEGFEKVKKMIEQILQTDSEADIINILTEISNTFETKIPEIQKIFEDLISLL